jgi:hypothetical protein
VAVENPSFARYMWTGWRATQSAANPSLERGSLLSAKVAKEKQPIFDNLAGIRLISAVISFFSELGCRVFAAALQGIDPSLGRKLNSELLRISGGGSAPSLIFYHYKISIGARLPSCAGVQAPNKEYRILDL